jgi:hypothetical protein
MTPEFVKLVRDMRESQKRWPMHPQQACIETMALEQKVDEALYIMCYPVVSVELKGYSVAPDGGGVRGGDGVGPSEGDLQAALGPCGK